MKVREILAEFLGGLPLLSMDTTRVGRALAHELLHQTSPPLDADEPTLRFLQGAIALLHNDRSSGMNHMMWCSVCPLPPVKPPECPKCADVMRDSADAILFADLTVSLTLLCKSIQELALKAADIRALRTHEGLRQLDNIIRACLPPMKVEVRSIQRAVRSHVEICTEVAHVATAVTAWEVAYWMKLVKKREKKGIKVVWSVDCDGSARLMLPGDCVVVCGLPEAPGEPPLIRVFASDHEEDAFCCHSAMVAAHAYFFSVQPPFSHHGQAD